MIASLESGLAPFTEHGLYALCPSPPGLKLVTIIVVLSLLTDRQTDNTGYDGMPTSFGIVRMLWIRLGSVADNVLDCQ